MPGELTRVAGAGIGRDLVEQVLGDLELASLDGPLG